jgi:hypothetical protein
MSRPFASTKSARAACSMSLGVPSWMTLTGPASVALPPENLDSEIDALYPGLFTSRGGCRCEARRVKLYSRYCEPFATKQMRPDQPARSF